MAEKLKFEEWVQREDAFPYYLQSRFARMFRDADIVSRSRGSHALVVYKGYTIAAWVCRSRSILLTGYPFAEGEQRDIIQRKLQHEYELCFELGNSGGKAEYDGYEAGYAITQHNIWHVIDYLEKVCRKIDNGFDRYSELLAKQGIEVANAGFLRVEIDNAFSVTELNRLLEAYNSLYALFCCACMNGCESITPYNMDAMQNKPNMIVESIHVGSNGLLIAVGETIIVDLLKEAVFAAFRGVDRIAAEKRREIAARAETDRIVRNNETVMRLIDQLDSVLARKAAGGNAATNYYLQSQILLLMEQIEELQGTKHIDVAV